MTEEEWLVSADLIPMLGCLTKEVSIRKLRLFGCACCRRIWHILTDERSRQAVETAERYADGLATEPELKRALEAAWTVGENAAFYLASDDAFSITWKAAVDVASVARDEPVMFLGRSTRGRTLRSYLPDEPDEQEMFLGRSTREVAAQCQLLRDIVGIPFRPLPVIEHAWTAWNDGTVVELAQAVYQEKVFDRLPILADALEAAGCNNEEILAHCRGSGPHVRGCWVVDLILGKK